MFSGLDFTPSPELGNHQSKLLRCVGRPALSLFRFCRYRSSQIVRNIIAYFQSGVKPDSSPALKSGVFSGTFITSFQPYQDIPKYINMSDVCINPFVINDTTRDIFPGKTVQFLACGKPLVMSPLDGVKAVISGEEQGVVYTNTDNEMVGAIISLLHSPEKRQELGQNGLRYVRRVHGCEKVAEQLEAELACLVKGWNKD